MGLTSLRHLKYIQQRTKFKEVLLLALLRQRKIRRLLSVRGFCRVARSETARLVVATNAILEMRKTTESTVVNAQVGYYRTRR